MEELVSRVLATQTAVKLAHWASQNGWEHQFLGDFYDALGAIDTIAEQYQGAFGLLGPVKNIVVSTNSIASHIADEAMWIEANRDRICRGVRALEARVDDLTSEYLHTSYKLANLVS